MIWKKKIKGGALQFVLFIGAVIAVLLFSFVLISQSHNLFRKKTDLLVSLIQASDSGLHYAFDETIHPEVQTEVPIRYPFQIKVTIEKKYWGIYELVTSEAKQGKNTFRRKALLGYNAKENLAALYLKDTKRPLVVAGDAKIIGNAFLPEQGIKAGSIYGNSFSNSTLLSGKQKSSSEQLPSLSATLLNQLKHLSNPLFEPKGELIVYKNKLRINNSFDQTTKVLKGRHIVLKDSELSGNIIVWATKKITVEAATKLQDIILIAPEIRIQNWVKGNFQAVASNTISVGKGCELAYPTALVVHKGSKKGNSTGSYVPDIYLDDYAQIKGTLIYKNDGDINAFVPQIKMEENAKVIGEVYNSGNTELRGRINGNITTGSFIALENGSIYQNHLYKGKINSTALSEHYAGILYY